MSQLLIHGNEINNFFQLLGENENDITYSIGWTLSQSQAFLKTFLKETIGWNKKIPFDDINIKLQEYKKQKHITITDIEVELPGKILIIVEAKKGWHYPTATQQKKYTSRLKKSNAEIKRILVLSECSTEYAHSVFKPGKRAQNLSYKELSKMVKKSYPKTKNYEKKLLKELNNYLSNIMTLQKQDSNLVYCVSLNNKKQKGWTITNKDIVRKKRLYEYPVGKRWPDPPNYIAFRYDGKLQSIHHVEGYDVFTNPHDFFKEAPSEKWEPRYILKLGKPFKPENEVKNGKIYPNGRYWCMLDTFFTCKTIKQARDVTQRREKIP